jgi:molecular chaperone IbpA
MSYNVPHFDPLTFISNLSKNSVGITDIFERFTGNIPVNVSYPFYNIIKTGDNTYVIEMAVAGFGRQDIELVLEDGVLTIKGEVKSDEKNDYLFKGIADRAFTRKFTLADTIEIRNADMLNGMLRVWLERLIPEHRKQRKIDIKTEDSPKEKSFLRD